MTRTEPLADSLEEASIVLDGRRTLVPGTPEYARLYVERPQVETDLLREAVRAERGPSTGALRAITDPASPPSHGCSSASTNRPKARC